MYVAGGHEGAEWGGGVFFCKRADALLIFSGHFVDIDTAGMTPCGRPVAYRGEKVSDLAGQTAPGTIVAGRVPSLFRYVPTFHEM